MTTEIRIKDYDYSLPEERIAIHPLEKRDQCRLLLRRPDGIVSHRNFKELAGLLPVGSRLFCNDTKVINARLVFHKPTGARIEVFLLEPVKPADYAMMFQAKGGCVWRSLVGNRKKWKGDWLSMTLKASKSGKKETKTEADIELRARIIPAEDKENENLEGEVVEFVWAPTDVSFAEVVERAGNIPIPPYLNRESEERDSEDYQTVYARENGSVAAPTAGLHFTPEVFEDLNAHNIDVEKLTLHVGAGTFKPVKSETIGEHPMHTETFTITLATLNSLISQKRERKPVAAVGTTTVRTLESLPLLGEKILRDGIKPGNPNLLLHLGQWEAYDALDDADTMKGLEALRDFISASGKDSLTASTAIMIAPGFKWRVTDAMVTNFHQPQSTLLLLVSSFLGENPGWKALYEEALRENYRFLSYGDACLLIK